MFTKTLATATASALLAGGAVAYTNAVAQTPASAKPPTTVGARYAQRQQKVAARQAELAQRLGVTVDQLKAANATLLQRALDARVSAGRLTAAERTAILACKGAPLTCDRTDLPAPTASRKALKRRVAKAKAKKNVAQRQSKRAANLAGELHLDQATVLAALQAQRAAHKKG